MPANECDNEVKYDAKNAVSQHRRCHGLTTATTATLSLPLTYLSTPNPPLLSHHTLHIPCPGHLCFHVTSDPPSSKQAGALFTGDALFQGGAGKFFEGDAALMLHILENVILPLPEETVMFPGHEYTVNNLTFAARVEPLNVAVQQRKAWAFDKRLTHSSTIPSTLAMERRWNPFVRPGMGLGRSLGRCGGRDGTYSRIACRVRL